MPESVVHQAVTEIKAVLKVWDLKFGNLVVVTLPASVADSADPIVKLLNNWWVTQSAFFRGAKMLVLKGESTLEVHGIAALREIGYVGLTDTIGGLTVRDILKEYMERNGIADEDVRVPVNESHSAGAGCERQTDRRQAAAAAE